VTQALILELTTEFAALSGNVGSSFITILSNLLDALRLGGNNYTVVGESVNQMFANVAVFLTNLVSEMACNENSQTFVTPNFVVSCHTLPSAFSTGI